MAKEIKKRPKLRFSEFTGDWEQRKFGDNMDLLTGFPFESEKFSDNGINLIRGMNVKRGYLDLSDSLCMKWKSSEGLEKYLLENEDILIQMDGALIGKSYAKIKKSQLPALLVQRVTRARAIPEESDSDFMYQTIQRDFLKYILLNKTDSAVPHLSLNDIREFPIRVPNLEEQKKIGKLLSNLDDLIALRQCELDELKELKKGMLQKMFPKKSEKVPEIRFPEFTRDWEQSKLGDVGNTYTGLSGKTADDFGHGEANFITYMNVYNNNIADPTMVAPIEIDSKQHEVEVGDVFFTTSSETPDEVGMACVLKEKQGIVYLNSFCFGFRPTKSFDLNFLAYMLRSNYVRNQIKILAQGVSRYNISKTKMMDVSIIFPDYEEQKKIGEYFSNFDNLINLQQKEIDGYKELKKGLLQQMFC